MWAGGDLSGPCRPKEGSIQISLWRKPRFAAIGMMLGRHWTAVITHRGGRVRLISVRRSHPKEERAYDEAVR